MNTLPSSYDKVLGTLDSIRPPSKERFILEDHEINRLRAALNGDASDWAKQIGDQLTGYQASKVSPKNLFTTKTTPFVFAAFFDCRFDRNLQFEFLHFEETQTPAVLKDIFPSQAYPVRIRKSSLALANERVTALFPEDWRFPENKAPTDLDQSQVYFFTCKWVNRFHQYSLPVLRRHLADDTFPHLRQAFSHSDNLGLAEQLCSDWMCMHEHSHRLGVLPYTFDPERGDLRPFKSGWHAGAFEELRSDVSGICSVLDYKGDFADYRLLLAEFILFERLVRYPIQFLCIRQEGEKLNYDSIASQMLFRFLRRTGHLRVAEGKLALFNWEEGLRNYLHVAQAAEHQALKLALAGDGEFNMRAGKEYLEEFVKRLGDYSLETKSYRLDSFYQECAKQISR